MEYSEHNQKLQCGECGNNFDPLARPGFLRFLAFILIANLLCIGAILIIEIIHVIDPFQG